MAQLYYRAGLHETPARFEHFFRSYPDYGSHQAGYCINAGLSWLLDWMQEARFRDDDLAYLRSQTGPAGERIFADDFLNWLQTSGSFEALSVSAIPEGRVVHPLIPLTVVEGPLATAQLLETALLNQLNYQVLVATKAARVRESGRGRPVLEFGLRRAQDRGATAATRAALIGGADFSSNVGASRVLGYPPKGTHAHSMVQAFIALGGSELDAFRAYADLYPDNCLLLVDTLDTLGSGIPNAIRVFEELQRKGYRPAGIRLDSGDLAYLSIQAARMLDAAGFPDTAIVLSNNLDELIIWQIVTQIEGEAPRYGVDSGRLIGRLVYGVGTRLVTSHGDACAGWRLQAGGGRKTGSVGPGVEDIRDAGEDGEPGEQTRLAAVRPPHEGHRGRARARREDLNAPGPLFLHHPTAQGKQRTLEPAELSGVETLLVDVLRQGRSRV